MATTGIMLDKIRTDHVTEMAAPSELRQSLTKKTSDLPCSDPNCGVLSC